LASSLALLVDPSNALFFSRASAFEIVAKASAGKLKLPTDPASFIAAAMKQGGID
jgi:PIN domain nuclease of toxin-antitoxin system